MALVASDVARPPRWSYRKLLVVVLIVAAAYPLIRLRRGELIDFRVPRIAAARFLAHEPLYRPEDGHYQFKYLPAFAAVMVPFTWLPKEAGELSWLGLLVVMAWVLIRWAVFALPDRRMMMSRLAILTFLLNAKFLVKEVGFGQFNLPLALLLWGAVIAAQRRRADIAGALVAAGTFVKPYAIVLLPWLVLRRRRGWLLPFAVVLAVGLALPVVSYGWDGNLRLLHDWYRTVTDTTEPNLATLENISFAALWARWFPVGPRTFLLTLMSSAVSMLAGVAMLLRRSSVAEPDYLEACYFSALIPLLSPQGWDYVLVLALPAYTCLVDRWSDTTPVWRAVTSAGFLLTSFGTYEVMRRTVYFHVMGWGGGTIGAVLVAACLLRLRWRRLA